MTKPCTVAIGSQAKISYDGVNTKFISAECEFEVLKGAITAKDVKIKNHTKVKISVDSLQVLGDDYHIRMKLESVEPVKIMVFDPPLDKLSVDAVNQDNSVCIYYYESGCQTWKD